RSLIKNWSPVFLISAWRRETTAAAASITTSPSGSRPNRVISLFSSIRLACFVFGSIRSRCAGPLLTGAGRDAGGGAGGGAIGGGGTATGGDGGATSRVLPLDSRTVSRRPRSGFFGSGFETGDCSILT